MRCFSRFRHFFSADLAFFAGLVVGAGLAFMCSFAQAECWTPIERELQTAMRRANEASREFEGAARAGAVVVDLSIRAWDGTEASENLRALNCRALLIKDTDLTRRMEVARLEGRPMEVLLGRRGYVRFRVAMCHAQRLQRRWENPSSLPEMVGALEHGLGYYSALAEELRSQPSPSPRGEPWDRYLPARARLMTALDALRPLARKLPAFCPCDSRATDALRPLTRPTLDSLIEVRNAVEGWRDQLALGEAPLNAVENPGAASARKRPTVRRSREEIRRRLREREQRERAARAEEVRRRREAARSAVLRSERELRAEAARAFEAMRNGGLVPPDIDWAMNRIEHDARGRRPRVTRGQLAEIRARWSATLAELRSIVATERDPELRVAVAREVLRSSYLSNYTEANATVLDAFLGEGTDCQGTADLWLAAVSQVPGLVPPSWEVGVQSFGQPPHVQLVLVPRDPNRHEVWDLMTHSTLDRRKGPVFRPALAAINGQASEESLKLRAMDPLTPEEQAILAAARGHEARRVRPRGGRRWASSNEGLFRDPRIPNPAHAYAAPLEIGPPRRGRAAPPVPTAPVERRGEGEESEGEAYTRLSLASSNGESLPDFALELANAHPNQSVAEFRVSLEAYLAANSPKVNDAAAWIERARDIDLLYGALRAPLPRAGGYPAAIQRSRRHFDAEASTLVGAVRYLEGSVDSHTAVFDYQNQRFRTVNGEVPLLQIETELVAAFQRGAIAPRRSEADFAALDESESASGIPPGVPRPLMAGVDSPVGPIGRVSGAGRPGRTRSMAEAELSAEVTLDAEIYRRAVEIAFNSGLRDPRMILTYLSLLRRSGITVIINGISDPLLCGRYYIQPDDKIRMKAFFEDAQKIDCPLPGSRSGRTPEDEYRVFYGSP